MNQCIKIISIQPMMNDKHVDASKDFIPICHNTFFRNNHPQTYVEINTCKSFSKSSQKKLKLINDSKSLEKSSYMTQQKRKIRPLKVRVKKLQTEDIAKQGLCSIKDFKAKINRITQESNIKTPVKCSTQQTDISQSIQTTKNNTNRHTYQTIGSKATITSLTCIRDPFPTLSNSLVVQEGLFNPESLLQTQNSIRSNHLSYGESPKYQQFDQVKRLVNFQTPIKQIHVKQEEDLSTIEKTEKKERLTLNMARKVETHETLKTQNDGCLSVVEQHEYKKFFENTAFPDYFSPKLRLEQNLQKSAISQNFSSYLNNESSE